MIKQVTIAALAIAVSASAFAFQPTTADGRRTSRTAIRQDAQSQSALKAQIRAKRREVMALRQAGDPRAVRAEQELRALEAQSNTGRSGRNAQRRQGHNETGQHGGNHQHND